MVTVAQVTYSIDDIKTRLLDHHECFEALVGMIAPQHYFPPKELDDDAHQGGRFGHNKKNKAPKQSIKEATRKARMTKLDPETPKTVSEIQQKMVQSIQAANEESNQDTDSKVQQPTAMHTAPLSARKMTAATAVELQDRLAKRIQALRDQRNHNHSKDNASSPSVPKTRQDIIEKRKLKKHQRKEDLLKKKDSRKAMDDTMGMDVQKPSHANASKELKMDVSFGKIDFGLEEKKKESIDAVALLKKVEAKKAKLETLKKTDGEKAQKIEEAQSWNKLIKMAEGVKVKDDLQLLKKTVKRQTQEKKKSSGEWKNRQEQVAKEQKQRQDKRQENIQTRIDAKRDRKFGGKKSDGKVGKKVAPAKGQKRPGFEGGVRKSKK
ncbi:hypothetical protein BATDEDRAFT_36411 [Batrachochytrium dendrobatidis JAM81]|uniref:Ribosomal RNA-processing protein 14/surfeit locus protein 6 C-terminal domain-containing protein n=2 Tax=Batrachochytrium dendrobatidis TaxID=109871 RepID=F4NUA9_BATDJ|nr:uncharacterized protein BATDEDRAFT_36411 [Batrachochytrium dendrobatidis JAM81]EGF83988.1 hypothetical protein BATDEDRAFT_36411 [Batrachochytrium dendrobatidis JAM81]OAJ36359.1 hypothetical protein BDEG_20540 [Batrachochytrium dendrobatidis JEL423]|eukprot:XP_006675854.1 hypothetical protein BATDEDRAFT_36411 [Batrachochytrium dendrobatidis JAM81]